jgi:hypothetical protein
MERLRIELEVMGVPAHFVGVNVAYAATYQDNLVARCAFPLFQDTFGVNAPELLQVHKDDILIYDSEGNLAHFLPLGGEINVNMQTPEGYENVKELMLSVD